MASTAGRAANSSSWASVGSPVEICMSADRVVSSKRDRADPVRRAPATVPSTRPPTTPTSNVRASMLRHRVRRR